MTTQVLKMTHHGESTRPQDCKHTKRWLESLVSGALSFRRMVKKEDLLKIFFIYLCLCHLVPAHPCGSNPLRRFRPLSRMLGKDIDTLLNLLRDSNPPLYRQVQDEWRLYADCVGLVDTGYFKRSGPQGSSETQGTQGTQGGQAVDPRSATRSEREERLMNLLHMMVSSGNSDDKDDVVV